MEDSLPDLNYVTENGNTAKKISYLMLTRANLLFTLSLTCHLSVDNQL